MQEISILPGRVRFRINELHYNKSLSKYLNIRIDNLYGVKSCNVNHTTSTILILFDTQKTCLSDIKKSINRTITSYNNQNENKEDTKEDKKEDTYEGYKKTIEKRNKAKRKLIIFSMLYIGLKIKNHIYGKFQLSSNINVLKTASAVTLIGGYPVIKGLYKSFAKNIPTDSDILLNLSALSLTILRESSKGVLVLVLKSLSDYIGYSSQAEGERFINQSMKKIYSKDRTAKPDISKNELNIYKRVEKYQNLITPVSFGAGLLAFIFTGSILRTVSVLLSLSPGAALTAISSGQVSYIALLNKHKAYIRNPNIIEKLSKADHIVFDMNGTLLNESSDTPKKGAYEIVKMLNRIGIMNISVLTCDNEDKAFSFAQKLGIKNVYSSCNDAQKKTVIQDLKMHETVIMVGDGKNDVEAMRSADVSISFVNSSDDFVKLNSDCLIFEDDLAKLADVFYLSRKAYSIINQNITFSQMYNLIWGSLSMYGKVDAFAAKAINTVNSLVVLLLSKRIEYINNKLKP